MLEVIAILISLVGAATGIYGAIIGHLGYKKSNKIALMELRMKHAEIHTDIQVDLDTLRDLCKKANESRTHRLAAQGLSRSGSMEKWTQKIDKEIKEINQLSLQFRSFKEIAGDETEEQLETDIRSMLLIDKKIEALIEGYEESIDEDDIARDNLFTMKFGSKV